MDLMDLKPLEPHDHKLMTQKSDVTDAALAEMSFEEAVAEIEAIVERLEQGEAPLDQSVRDYERGIALKLHCEELLRQAQLRIETIEARKPAENTTESS